jgi:hypothetical protein
MARLFWIVCIYSLVAKLAGGAPCKPQKQSFIVSNPAQAAKLVDAALCEGGEINVKWLNRVIMQDTIKLGNNTVLTMQGSGESSIIDGNQELRLFNVSSSSTLVLQDMTVQNGFATAAGAAVFVRNNATLQLDSCLFKANNCTQGKTLTMAAIVLCSSKLRAPSRIYHGHVSPLAQAVLTLLFALATHTQWTPVPAAKGALEAASLALLAHMCMLETQPSLAALLAVVVQLCTVRELSLWRLRALKTM